jgi:hypothetical protein
MRYEVHLGLDFYPKVVPQASKNRSHIMLYINSSGVSAPFNAVACFCSTLTFLSTSLILSTLNAVCNLPVHGHGSISVLVVLQSLPAPCCYNLVCRVDGTFATYIPRLLRKSGVFYW